MQGKQKGKGMLTQRQEASLSLVAVMQILGGIRLILGDSIDPRSWVPATGMDRVPGSWC